MEFIANWAAPQLKTIIFEQVKNDVKIGLPFGGELFMNEPGDPTFDGCTFSIPMQMGVEGNIVDISNVGIFNLEGTLQPWSLLRGQVCLADVQVTDYKIDGIDLNLDTLLGGQLPAIALSDQACMSILDTAQVALNHTGILNDVRMLRGSVEAE